MRGRHDRSRPLLNPSADAPLLLCSLSSFICFPAFPGDGSPEFNDFLAGIGQRIKLKGFTGFKGGLDTVEDMTGSESVYCKYGGNEIMMHVSTLLPYDDDDEQQVKRKRHIGTFSA